MDLFEHKQQFDEIIRKYNLDDQQKAEEISCFLTDKKNKDSVSYEEFSKLFLMTKDEAKLFLSFIATGLKFKEDMQSSLK